jgi:hypothetical protein
MAFATGKVLLGSAAAVGAAHAPPAKRRRRLRVAAGFASPGENKTVASTPSIDAQRTALVECSPWANESVE